ncbi:MAG: 3-dehydroquinate synthase family protein [Acidimicrobiales bacterium]
MINVGVDMGARSYEVVIGAGARHRLGEVLPAGARRAVIVTQAGIPWTVDPGVPSGTLLIGDGEGAKSMATITDLCRGFARAGITRADVIVAVGGGVVTDVAGFAAACWHRGVPVVHVATTLLGQVDAAIGGKCGVNLPEGKNLVGAFWQPAAVLCDTETLESLPPAEYRSGLGEMAKYAFLDPDRLDPSDLARLPIDERVARCVTLKASVVVADERESGRRALLNYGHTLAHALEAAGWAGGDAGTMRHGEAVAVGLAFAALLGRRLGRLGDHHVAEHAELLEAYGLSTSLPAGADRCELIELMKRDKKALRGLTFVLDGPQGLEVVAGVEEGPVRDALADLAMFS